MNALSTIPEICVEFDQLILCWKDQRNFEKARNVCQDMRSWLEYTRPSISPNSWHDLIEKLREFRHMTEEDRWVCPQSLQLSNELSSLQYSAQEKQPSPAS